jgi:urease accessory protein
MRARARLEAALAPDCGTTHITRLRSEPPLTLRPTKLGRDEPRELWNLGDGGAARVSVAAAAAGPIGGDQLRLEIDVGPGATLVLRTVGASLALPGPHGESSRAETTIRVAAGATVVWLPQPLIAASRCNHRAVTTMALDEGARLLAREELVLGRRGECCGSIRQRLRVTLAGRALYDQELCIGEADGWDGPAVTGGRRALGTLLLVDPALDPATRTASVGGAGVDSAILPLARAGTVVTALADDSLTLRRHLDREWISVQGGPRPAEPAAGDDTTARPEPPVRSRRARTADV